MFWESVFPVIVMGTMLNITAFLWRAATKTPELRHIVEDHLTWKMASYNSRPHLTQKHLLPLSLLMQETMTSHFMWS